MSAKEEALLGQVKKLESIKNPTAVDKHRLTMARALADTARINREHPGSAAALGGLTGAITGAALAPSVQRLAGGLLRR